ncbi:hypothetical protein AA313_de0201663 [Arthrobotrys entomopaga]|nr:hypothetical protein AA313_de0201663 [Arthrobotrys entomopaga]
MSSRTTFNPSWKWILIRYLQVFFSIFCFVYLNIARSTVISHKSKHRQIKGKDLQGARGYFVIFSILGCTDALNITFIILVACTKLVTPIIDVIFNLFIVTTAVGGIIATAFVYHGFRLGQLKYDSSSGFSTTAFILTFITFSLLYLIGSLWCAYLSYRQHIPIKKEAKATERLRRTLAQMDAERLAAAPQISTTIDISYSGPVSETAALVTTTPSSSGQRPVSFATSQRPTSSVTAATHPSGRSRDEGEPKPLLTRQQQIQARIDAVAAPPTYFYATSLSSHRRGESSSTRWTNPEDGDDELPTYMAFED